MATAAEKEAKAAAKESAQLAVTQGRDRQAAEIGSSSAAFKPRNLRAGGDLSRYRIGGFSDDPNAIPPTAPKPTTKPKPKPVVKPPSKAAPKPTGGVKGSISKPKPKGSATAKKKLAGPAKAKPKPKPMVGTGLGSKKAPAGARGAKGGSTSSKMNARMDAERHRLKGKTRSAVRGGAGRKQARPTLRRGYNGAR